MSLDTFKENITNTVLELRKQANLKVVFVDNNEENPKEIQNLYFLKDKNPTVESDNKVVNSIDGIFRYYIPLNMIPDSEMIKESTKAITKGREVLRNKNYLSNMLGINPKTYALTYTKWNYRFMENNSIIIDMEDAIGLIVGKRICYYEDKPISYDQSNIIPLVKFLLRGDHLLIKLEKTGEKSWELKVGADNNINDVIVLQKVLVARGYLKMPLDTSGNPISYGIFDNTTQYAVMKYQQSNGINPSEIVDKNTWTSLLLPWDSKNEKPLRDNYDYLTVLNTDIDYSGILSNAFDLTVNSNIIKVGETVQISGMGEECGIIQLFINGNFVKLFTGNSFIYNYKIPSVGSYTIEVRASKRVVPYDAWFSASEKLIHGINEKRTCFVFYSAYDYPENIMKIDFEGVAKAAGEYLEDTYNAISTLYACSGASEFQQHWNELAKSKVQVDEIIIISHGADYELKFIDKEGDLSNIVMNDITNIQGRVNIWTGELDDIEVGILNIFACNAGYLGESGEDTDNVATSFLQNIDGIQEVYAYDGYVKIFMGKFYLALKGRLFSDNAYFTDRRPKGRHVFTMDENNEIHVETVENVFP